MSLPKKITLQSPKGMHDILPADQPYWQHVVKKAKTLLYDYSFERLDTPIVEQTGLFVRSVGVATDIVEKELYGFKTKGEMNWPCARNLPPGSRAPILNTACTLGPTRCSYGRMGRCFATTIPRPAACANSTKLT